MELKWGNYHITVEPDLRFSLRETEHPGYDLVHNPCRYRPEELHGVLAVTVTGPKRSWRAALVGSYYTVPHRCALAEEGALVILQEDVILRLKLEDGTLTEWADVGDQGSYFSLYPLEGGYFIHGDVEAVKLDRYFRREWEFVGAEIFVSPEPGEESCRLEEDLIWLKDLNGYEYRLDFDGYPL